MENLYKIFGVKKIESFDSVEQYKANFIMNLVALLDVILHLTCTIFFVVPSNNSLILNLNMLATLVCIISFYINLKGYTDIVVWILTLEVGIYSFIWVIFLGPYVGAQYFIFSVLIPHYLFTSFKKKRRIFVTIFLFVCLILSSLYGFYNTPIINHPFPRLLNIFITAIIFLSFVLILHFNELVDKFGEDLYRNNISKIEKISYKDQLTGLFNRLYFQTNKDKILKNISSKQYCIALFDLDFFKKVNDTYSHEAGDLLLKHFSNIMTTNLTPKDTVMRWGGEEFLVIMEDSDQEQASIKVNKVLDVVRNEPLEYKGNMITFTFTCGITEIKHNELFSDCVNIADELLYLGKQQGRNRVVVNSRKS